MIACDNNGGAGRGYRSTMSDGNVAPRRAGKAAHDDHSKKRATDPEYRRMRSLRVGKWRERQAQRSREELEYWMALAYAAAQQAINNAIEWNDALPEPLSEDADSEAWHRRGGLCDTIQAMACERMVCRETPVYLGVPGMHNLYHSKLDDGWPVPVRGELVDKHEKELRAKAVEVAKELGFDLDL